jgi:hypothetical protein
MCGIGYSESSSNLKSVILDCNDWLDIGNGKKKYMHHKKKDHVILLIAQEIKAKGKKLFKYIVGFSSRNIVVQYHVILVL